MDAKSAFLNGDLKEEIYMKILPGQDRPEEHVWQLRKALYGLKQASQEWYTKVHEVMVGLGCYDSKLKVLSNKTTPVLSNTRELDRVSSTK